MKSSYGKVRVIFHFLDSSRILKVLKSGITNCFFLIIYLYFALVSVKHSTACAVDTVEMRALGLNQGQTTNRGSSWFALRPLTFTFEQLGNFSFFIQIRCWVNPWFHRFMLRRVGSLQFFLFVEHSLKNFFIFFPYKKLFIYANFPKPSHTHPWGRRLNCMCM